MFTKDWDKKLKHAPPLRNRYKKIKRGVQLQLTPSSETRKFYSTCLSSKDEHFVGDKWDPHTVIGSIGSQPATSKHFNSLGTAQKRTSNKHFDLF